MMEENKEEKDDSLPQEGRRFSWEDALTVALTVMGLGLFLLGEWTDNVIIEVAGSTFFLAFWMKWLIEHSR